MKNIKFLLLPILLLFVIACSDSKNAASAGGQAGQSDKISILFVEQSGCGSCELLKDTFKKADVKKILDSDFEVKFIDISKANTLPKGVMEPFGTPTLYFVSSNGKELHEPIIGAKSKDDLIDVLNQIKNDYKAKSAK
ncbi:MAG: hypothetical protein KN64_11900 [Sulfurovum sp. AS07-7]|nr:MAG: hypothetical protein KN64_11900 [Sulfurovum sp. AS07-7]